MQYLLIIYGNEKTWETMSPAEQEKGYGAYMEFSKGIVKNGNYRGGEALESIRTATTVRVKDGKILRHDGPYAETKEQLGGYYLVEAKDLDEAIAIAARIPELNYGGAVEVRPVMPTPKLVD